MSPQGQGLGDVSYERSFYQDPCGVRTRVFCRFLSTLDMDLVSTILTVAHMNMCPFCVTARILLLRTSGLVKKKLPSLEPPWAGSPGIGLCGTLQSWHLEATTSRCFKIVALKPRADEFTRNLAKLRTFCLCLLSGGSQRNFK